MITLSSIKIWNKYAYSILHSTLCPTKQNIPVYLYKNGKYKYSYATNLAEFQQAGWKLTTQAETLRVVSSCFSFFLLSPLCLNDLYNGESVGEHLCIVLQVKTLAKFNKHIDLGYILIITYCFLKE